MSAMMMAVYFRGMDTQETFELTMAMAESGDRLDLSGVCLLYTSIFKKHRVYKHFIMISETEGMRAWQKIKVDQVPGRDLYLLILVVQFCNMLKRRGSENTDTVITVLNLFPCQLPAFPEILSIHGGVGCRYIRRNIDVYKRQAFSRDLEVTSSSFST